MCKPPIQDASEKPQDDAYGLGSGNPFSCPINLSFPTLNGRGAHLNTVGGTNAAPPGMYKLL